jgi:hypothetical protein
VCELAFSEDSAQLVSSAYDTVRVVAAADGSVVAERPVYEGDPIRRRGGADRKVERAFMASSAGLREIAVWCGSAAPPAPDYFPLVRGGITEIVETSSSGVVAVYPDEGPWVAHPGRHPVEVDIRPESPPHLLWPGLRVRNHLGTSRTRRLRAHGGTHDVREASEETSMRYQPPASEQRPALSPERPSDESSSHEPVSPGLRA